MKVSPAQNSSSVRSCRTTLLVLVEPLGIETTQVGNTPLPEGGRSRPHVSTRPSAMILICTPTVGHGDSPDHCPITAGSACTCENDTTIKAARNAASADSEKTKVRTA